MEMDERFPAVTGLRGNCDHGNNRCHHHRLSSNWKPGRGSNLARAVEERASGDAITVESMINGSFSMVGLDPAMTVGELLDTADMAHRESLTLDLLAGPQGLDVIYPWINPNPPMDPDGGREDSGRGGRELQAR